MQVIAKVLPIERIINDTRRRADDYWWEGEDDKAKAEEVDLADLKQQQEEGVVWVPNF